MSDKVKVIDHATFERMQQSGSRVSTLTTAPKIRNSKYKRMSATNNFNLMQFAKAKPQKQGLEKKGKIRKRVIDTRIVQKKNKGKKRENSVKKPTRLKKSILQYRQKKREQAQMEKQSSEQSENELKILELNDGKQNEKRLVPGIHSSTFREYCNCYKTDDLRKYSEQLIRELNNFQRRAYAQNEIKARAHKRFVVGFRQVQSYININKIKLVIIATDCERSEGEKVSLDDTIESIKTTCNDKNIPVVFAFRRREMAYFIFKKASISCIGILDYDGAREIFSQVLEALKNAREKYDSLLSSK